MASAEMESIKNMPYGDLPNPPSLDLWPLRSGEVNVGNLNGYRDVYVKGDSSTGYKQVRVAVTWQDPGKSGPQSVSLDTYIAP